MIRLSVTIELHSIILLLINKQLHIIYSTTCTWICGLGLNFNGSKVQFSKLGKLCAKGTIL